MIRILTILCLALTALAEPISPRLAGDIATAVWIAEGGHLARQHFGITTRKVRDYAHARAITLAVIHQEWDRWERGGRRGTFYAAFARRWCSPRADAVGHRNLVRNLTLIMRHADRKAATR
jgi:hypothetical protein